MPEDEPDEEIEAAPLPEKITGEDLAMLLLSIPERLSDVLLGLTPAQLGYRHGPAFPTADEIARHVASAGTRLDGQVTASALGAPPAESTDSPDAELQELLHDWQRRRRRAADLLRGLPAERWDEQLDDLCQAGLQHELAHLSQLRNLTALIPVA